MLKLLIITDMLNHYLNRRRNIKRRIHGTDGDLNLQVCKSINVPVSRIQDILNDRRKITPDTSLSLAYFYGVSDRYCLNLENDIDIRNLKISMDKEIENIEPFTTVLV